jgi:glycosyltransferase involved in cell wall biosynthesis
MNIIGFFLSEIGLGHSARYLSKAALSSKINVKNVNVNINGRSNDIEFINELSPYAANDVNLIVCGLLSVPKFLDAVRPMGMGSKNYIRPYWELDRTPVQFKRVFEQFDDVIAPSVFISNSYKYLLDRDIKIIPTPVPTFDILKSNVPSDGVLRIFTSMDFDSYEKRKNPMGTLKAFQAAFPVSVRDVQLIVKVRGDRDLGDRKLLQEEASKDARILLIDKVLPRKELDELLEKVNVYISLHRSEGFGLGPAEALAKGKIVLSTDYGGTTDFINQSTGFPIQYKIIPVGEKEYPRCENQIWADPLIDHATDRLRFIYESYNSALEVARNGQIFMHENFSYEAVGKLIKEIIV